MPNMTTRKAVAAFMNRAAYKKFGKNTEVYTNEVSGDTYLELHGSPIAWLDPDNVLRITSAGWETHTTKERLNGLPNVNVYQHQFQWYLNGEKWEDSGKWTKV